MITLYQFARTWGIPNLSQFCAKVETYLRMAQLPYRIVNSMPLKAPRGKLPYIEDGGKKIADSRLIVHYLKSTYGDPLDGHLSPREQGVAAAFQRLLEEHLYWVSMFTRWSYGEQNWQTNKRAIFGVLPPVLRDLAAWGYRHRIKSQMRGHGLGRHTPDEVFALGEEDMDALSNFLADKPYFLGDKPTSLDASAFGVLVNIVECPIESPAKDYARAKTNIRDYCSRMQREFFPELSEPTQQS
jgi:glutathione S-transferase